MPRIAWGFAALLLALLAGCDNTTAEEHFARAEALIAERELPSAVIELKNALRKRKAYAEANVLLAQTRFQLGEYPAALEEYERALELGALDANVRAGLLETKVRVGRHQEVIGELADERQLAPSLALALADAYAAAGEVGLARQWYEQALSLARAHAGLAAIAWAEGDAKRAAAHFDRAAEMDPRDRDTWLRRGDFYLAERDAARGRSSFEAARDLPGDRMPARLGIVRSYLIEGDLATARARIDEIVAQAPQPLSAQYLLGVVAFEQGDIEAARTALSGVLRVAPDYAPARYLIGSLEFSQREYLAAERSLARYLETDPGNLAARKLLASAHAARGDSAGVASVLEGVALDSQDPELLALLGSAELALGDLVAGSALLERAVALAPDAAVLRNRLAAGLMEAGETAQAQAVLEGAKSADPAQVHSDYLLVMLHVKEGDLEEAARLADEIVARDPDGAIGHNLRGLVLLRQQNETGAVASFETALAKDPLFLPAAINLSRLAAARGDFAAARGVLDSILARAPNDVGALLGLADLAMQRVSPAEAETLLLRAVDADPDHVPARLALLRLYVVQNNLEKADAAANATLAVAPRSVETLLLRAEIDLRRGDVDAAGRRASMLQEMLVVQERNLAFALALADLQARVGNLTLARRNFERALEISQDESVEALQGLAQLDLMEGQSASARTRIDRLRAKGVAGAELDLLDGDLALKEGDAARAVHFYQRLVDADVREGVFRLAQLYFEQDTVERSNAVFRDWLARNPGDTGARVGLANNALQAGNSDEALAAYEQLMPTDDAVVLNNLAWLYLDKGDARALELARAAYERSSGSPEIADTLGWVLLEQGAARDAVPYLTESARALPDNATVQYHLGIAHMRTGATALARRALSRALELGEFPESEDARQALAGL